MTIGNIKDLQVLIPFIQRSKEDIEFYLTEEEFEAFNCLGAIKNIDNGGLVNAPSHEEGGVRILIKSEGKYTSYNEMEGWEFVIKDKISFAISKELDELNHKFNSINSPHFKEYEIPKGITIIDAMPISVYGTQMPVMLYISTPQITIINKHATKETIEILEEFNRAKV